MSTKQSTKRAKHRAKKSYDQNKEVITWDVLTSLAQDIMSTLGNYERLVSEMAKTYPDRLNDFKCKETYAGFYKLLEEHLNQLVNLIKLHSEVDANGEIKKDSKGVFLYKKGICKTQEEMSKVTTLLMEYMNEQTLVTELGSKVLPELAVQFQVSKEIMNVITDLSASVIETENNAVKELADGLKENFHGEKQN
jgi:hypothetical protein|nr:MAG TPA: hypothetical protein [Caudoviricetes sp.]